MNSKTHKLTNLKTHKLNNVSTMNLLSLIKSRYSCRSYEARAIETEKMSYVMECVRMAPSAVNRQPWRFHIVEGDEGRQLVQQCYDREWFKSAPVYVVATVMTDEQWVRADGKPHGDIDVVIAVEHLCLAATEVGLGTCWVCNFDAALCRQLPGMKQGEEPVVIIPIGYPAVEAAEKRRKTMDEIVVKL